MEHENKTRIPAWLRPSTIRRMGGWLETANCKSRSEFIEKSLHFYMGYLGAEDASEYLPNALTATLRGIVADSTNRTNGILFKCAVEPNEHNMILPVICPIGTVRHTTMRGPTVSAGALIVAILAAEAVAAHDLHGKAHRFHRNVDFGLYLGYLELGVLEGDDALSERLALLGVLDGLVECALRDGAGAQLRHAVVADLAAVDQGMEIFLLICYGLMTYSTLPSPARKCVTFSAERLRTSSRAVSE